MIIILCHSGNETVLLCISNRGRRQYTLDLSGGIALAANYVVALVVDGFGSTVVINLDETTSISEKNFFSMSSILIEWIWLPLDVFGLKERTVCSGSCCSSTHLSFCGLDVFRRKRNKMLLL